MAAIHEQTWRDSALCLSADPDMFYPAAGAPTTAARRLCQRCDVQTDCRDYALATNQTHGVWGGTSTGQRHLQQAGT